MAAFDVDGTLVSGDSLLPFLLTLLGRRRLATRAAPALGPMAAAWRQGGRSPAKEALLARTVAGLAAEDVAVVGERFGTSLAGRVRPHLAERLDWHRARGHRLVLVSASLTDYLEPLARLLGAEVVATRLEVADGRLTGRLIGANVRGEEKVARLAAHLGLDRSGLAAVELWAYGDSKGDAPLLAAADHPTWVRGSGRAHRQD